MSDEMTDHVFVHCAKTLWDHLRLNEPAVSEAIQEEDILGFSERTVGSGSSVSVLITRTFLPTWKEMLVRALRLSGALRSAVNRSIPEVDEYIRRG